MLKISNNWKSYKLITTGNKEKIESWNGYIVNRPDPQAIWKQSNSIKIDAKYFRSNKGGGHWEYYNKPPKNWTIDYNDLKFKISLTDFKHTGLFPEQAIMWDFMIDKIKNDNRDIKILNLFAYTGGATMACAFANASVVHVDASKNIVKWAKENMELSKLTDRNIRFIVDDVFKFIKREQRRNNKYHGIIMDPPSYGKGPNNELFKFETHINDLIKETLLLLEDKPLFFIINSYTTGISSITLYNIFNEIIKNKYPNYKIEYGELGLQDTNNNILPCGIFVKMYA